MKVNRTSRIIQLLTVLQTHRQYTPADLAAVIGTSVRTLYRDIKALQEAGVKFHYNQKGGCYDPNSSFQMPPLELSTEEAFALFLLVYRCRDHINFPLSHAALMGALKIENNLPPPIRRYCIQALRGISLLADPQGTGEFFDRTFLHLHKAIINKRQIKICYRCPKKSKEIIMDFNPYHLLYNQRAWYLLGKSHSDKLISTINLNHIKNIQILDSNFIEEPPFNLCDYLGRAWAMLPEGQLYNVKLRFTPEVAYDVTSVRWHETQMVSFEDGGSAIVEFRVDGLNEITWWILSYGDQVEVLAPRVLRQRIMQIAQKIANPCRSASAFL